MGHHLCTLGADSVDYFRPLFLIGNFELLLQENRSLLVR